MESSKGGGGGPGAHRDAVRVFLADLLPFAAPFLERVLLLIEELHGRAGPGRTGTLRTGSGAELGAPAPSRFLRKGGGAGGGGGGRGAVRFWRKGGATAHARDADCDITRAGPAALCALYGSAATLCGISASLCGGGVAARMRSEHGTMRVTKP